MQPWPPAWKVLSPLWGSLLFGTVLALLAACSPAVAQQVVQETPAPLSPVGASSTIASGNTFQEIFAAQGPQATTFNTTTGATTVASLRRGCLIINTSNTVAYVFFGALASATTPTSVPLTAASADGTAGGSTTCERAGAGTLQSQVSITGATAGETFFAIRY